MKKTVMIFGSFDLLHPGHRALVAHAKQLGTVHAVLARDETIVRLKGRPPFNSLNVRMHNLEQWGVTTHAGSAVDKLEAVKKILPDIFLLGHDQEAFVDQLEQYVKDHPESKILRMPVFKDGLFSSRRIRRMLEDPESYFVIVDKPTGEGSMRTVSILRKKLNKRKIGFAGTLDPLASGLLVCGIGGATGLLDWFHEFPKTYVTTIVLGKEADTYDADGIIQEVSSHEPKKSELTALIKKMIGTQLQEPPMFSAKQVEGTRLYSLARKGKKIEREKNKIIVEDAKLISYSYPRATISIRCSTGTYIRSLVHDLGRSLSVGAYVETLRRTEIGPFTENDARPVDDFDPKTIAQRSVPLSIVLEKLYELYDL